MTPRPAPAHMRRAQRARRIRLVLGVAAAGFALYRIGAIFFPR